MSQSTNAHSSLQFLGYEVSELSFNIKSTYDKIEVDKKISYVPRFERSIKKKSESAYDLHLSVSVGDDQSGLPFTATVKLIGRFELVDIEDPVKVISINATAILFPYLRAALSQLTTLANINTLTLPTFNITKMFEEEAKKEKKSRKHSSEKESEE